MEHSLKIIVRADEYVEHLLIREAFILYIH